VEYTDYQCPFCSRVQPTIDAILERYGDNVQHVFKQLPLPMHPQAKLGAEASLCANDQGKFWELHDWLFANKNSINREALSAQAGEIGLELDAFNGCLDEQKYSAQVDEEMREAQGFGITGTPGFLINGRALRGAVPLDQFIAIIDEELAMAGIEVPEPATTEATGESS
jgi:protein-disulfide isomerase